MLTCDGEKKKCFERQTSLGSYFLFWGFWGEVLKGYWEGFEKVLRGLWKVLGCLGEVFGVFGHSWDDLRKILWDLGVPWGGLRGIFRGP